MTRNDIIRNAIQFNGYNEGNSRDIASYDTPQGAIPAGNRNFNRFSFIFDNLAEPKIYAGGTKDGYPWCACFVTTTFGTANISQEHFCRHLNDSNPADLKALKQQYQANIRKALGTLTIAQISALAGVSTYSRIGLPQITPASAKPADIIIFGNNAHIGIIEKTENGHIFTIEGNTTIKEPNPNGGQVARKCYKIINHNALLELHNNRYYKSWQKFKILMTKLPG